MERKNKIKNPDKVTWKYITSYTHSLFYFNFFSVLRLFLVLFHGFLWAWWQRQLPLSGVEDHLPLSAPAVHLLWAGLHFALFVRTARAAAAAGVWHCSLQTMQFPWVLTLAFFLFLRFFLFLSNYLFVFWRWQMLFSWISLIVLLSSWSRRFHLYTIFTGTCYC